MPISSFLLRQRSLRFNSTGNESEHSKENGGAGTTYLAGIDLFTAEGVFVGTHDGGV